MTVKACAAHLARVGSNTGVAMAGEQEDVERARALLESQHDFPGPFSFRVVVRPADTAVAVSAVASSLGAEAIGGVATKESRNGKYVSLHISTSVQNADEVLSVYDILKSTREIVVVL